MRTALTQEAALLPLTDSLLPIPQRALFPFRSKIKFPMFKFWSILTQKNFIKSKLLEILKYNLNVKAQ